MSIKKNKKIIDEIIEVSKAMYGKGMLNAFEGNVSVREGDLIYITPTSVCKGILTEEMIVITDEEGNVLEGDRKPSSEIKLHLAAYRLRRDIKSVVHNHSVFATAFSIANKPIETKAYPELMIAFDKIPVVEYGTPSTDRIHLGIKKYINDSDAFLLANHGVVALGSSPFDAFYKIEAVESIAKTLTIVKVLGGESPISDEEIDVLYKLRKKSKGEG